jgi:hypothetical protein
VGIVQSAALLIIVSWKLDHRAMLTVLAMYSEGESFNRLGEADHLFVTSGAGNVFH